MGFRRRPRRPLPPRSSPPRTSPAPTSPPRSSPAPTWPPRTSPTSDVSWDEVAGIEPLGERETFDLTVPEGHSFVADDIIVHNSTLATNIAENAAIDHGVAVALFSLEMSETKLAHRFIASQAKVSSDELRKGRVRGDRWPKVLSTWWRRWPVPRLPRRLERYRGPRDARQGAPSPRSARAGLDRGGLPPTRPPRGRSDSRVANGLARSAAGSRSSLGSWASR